MVKHSIAASGKSHHNVAHLHFEKSRTKRSECHAKCHTHVIDRCLRIVSKIVDYALLSSRQFKQQFLLGALGRAWCPAKKTLDRKSVV